MLRCAAVENPTARRNYDRSQPACRYYLTPDVPYISASCVPAARLDPRFDRGNNDWMERTMDARGRGWKRYCLAPSRSKQTFDSTVTSDPCAPPRCTKHRNRYTTIPRFTPTRNELFRFAESAAQITQIEHGKIHAEISARKIFSWFFIMQQ